MTHGCLSLFPDLPEHIQRDVNKHLMHATINIRLTQRLCTLYYELPLILVNVHIHQQAVQLPNKSIVQFARPRKLSGPTLVDKDLMNSLSFKYIHRKFWCGSRPLHHHLVTNNLTSNIKKRRSSKVHHLKKKKKPFKTVPNDIKHSTE